MSNFTTGQQPCNDFRPEQTGPYEEWDNLHDCYAAGCRGQVSWCENCLRDHHKGGYETCTKIWEKPNTREG